MNGAELLAPMALPPRSGGSTAEGGEGGIALAPSTILRMVPLPRFAGEEPKDKSSHSNLRKLRGVPLHRAYILWLTGDRCI